MRLRKPKASYSRVPPWFPPGSGGQCSRPNIFSWMLQRWLPAASPDPLLQFPPLVSLPCAGAGGLSSPSACPSPGDVCSTHWSLVAGLVLVSVPRTRLLPHQITSSRKSWATMKTKQNKPKGQLPPKRHIILHLGLLWLLFTVGILKR